MSDDQTPTATSEQLQRAAWKPRARTTSAMQRADALALAAWARPSVKGLRSVRRRIVQMMWDARRAGDRPTYLELRRTYAQVCDRLAREGRRLSPEDRLLRQRLRDTPPVQQQREAEQRVRADGLPRVDPRAAQQQRDAGRLGANALAHALWAIHAGERDWDRIPTRPSTAQAAAPTGQPTNGSAPGPERLEVTVPANPALGVEAHVLHLYRMDYERLLDEWGYWQVARAGRLAAKLRATADAADLAALHGLALSAARSPNLARSWHAFVTSPRFGDVFRVHVSGTVQLSPNRNGDLREALLAIRALAQVRPVAYQDRGP